MICVSRCKVRCYSVVTGHTLAKLVVGAVSADKIVAQPGTITGSVGVYIKLLNMAPALKKAGVNVESVSVGKYALVNSGCRNRTPDENRW